MPNFKFIWGSSASFSLTLETGRTGLKTTFKQERNLNMAASGKTEVINLYGIMEMETDCYITSDKYRDAVAFWSWARQGKPFAFANSASKVGSTTVASSVSASATSIVLTSGSSFSASDTALMRSASSDDVFELVKISAISSNSVTLTAGTKYAYASGAVFRDSGYIGSCIMMDTTFDPQQSDAGFYPHRFKFMEDL